MRNALFSIGVLAFLLLAACRQEPEPPAGQAMPFQSQIVLSTVGTVMLYEEGFQHIYDEIFARIREIEGAMSLFLYESYVNRINSAAGLQAVRVPAEVFFVIERALFYAELSGGAFDPTVGPLTRLWQIGGEVTRVPSQEEIALVLPLVNFRNVELDGENQTVFLREAGMVLDLGAIAKGYAADEAAFVIRRLGIPRAIVDLGGDLSFVGARHDGQPWRVGIQSPTGELGAFFGILQTEQAAVVTSGVYQRYFVYGGSRYHHLLSPFDGEPAESGLLSITVIAGTAITADALATAAFVLGYELGRELVESAGAQAIFVTEGRTVRLTGGLAAGIDFILTDPSFALDG